VTATRAANNRKKARRRAIFFVSAVVCVFLFIGVLAGAYSFLSSLAHGGEDVDAPAVEPGERINVLLLGVDADQDANGKVVPADLHSSWTRTDVMILLSFDPVTNELGMLSLPRDTRVQIAGYGTQKLAHAHAFGGPQLAMETVSDFLDVPIHYYVRTNFAGFINIVDILGGFDMYIEESMYYRDPYQDLEIDIPAGQQHFDGEKALELVRYRQYWNGDIGRVEMQQKLINALLDKAFRLGTILKLPSLASELLKYVDTNMEPGQILSLANTARKMDQDLISMEMLPGHFTDGSVYWEPDRDRIALAVDKLIRGIDRERNAQISIEVQNGTTVAGAANALADRLRAQGYVIAGIGNADRSDISRLGMPIRLRDAGSGDGLRVVIGADFNLDT